MNKPSIIDQWETNFHTYRLAVVDNSRYSLGCHNNDYFILEMLSSDSQGEKCWVETVHEHTRDVTNVLAARLKELHARNSQK